MDGALDTEQSTFSLIKRAVDANQSLLITYFPYTLKQWMKNVQSRIRFGGISYNFLQFPFLQSNPLSLHALNNPH